MHPCGGCRGEGGGVKARTRRSLLGGCSATPGCSTGSGARCASASEMCCDVCLGCLHPLSPASVQRCGGGPQAGPRQNDLLSRASGHRPTHRRAWSGRGVPNKAVDRPIGRGRRAEAHDDEKSHRAHDRCSGRLKASGCRSDPPPPPPIGPGLLLQTVGQGCIPQRRPQKRLDRRLEEVAKAVGGGYCRLQMPLSLALAVRETVAGRRRGRPGGRGGSPLPMRRGGGGPKPPVRSGWAGNARSGRRLAAGRPSGAGGGGGRGAPATEV